jgi:hypothetical protein
VAECQGRKQDGTPSRAPTHMVDAETGFCPAHGPGAAKEVGSRALRPLGGVTRPLGWFRRTWETSGTGRASGRKHLPEVEVAKAGGWNSLGSLRTAYQQADEITMLRVVMGAGEPREVR